MGWLPLADRQTHTHHMLPPPIRRDTWGRLVAPFTSRQPWMYCVGNHEIELTDGRKDFLSYLTR